MALKKLCRSIVQTFQVREDQPALVLAQVKALSRQIPLLYLLLFANALALAYTHFGTAPDWMTVYIPVVLGLVCLMRGIAWMRVRETVTDFAHAVIHLRRIRILAAVISIVFTAWAIKMFGYGDAYQQGHVAYFISVTVVGCIFCLLHFPPAALLVVVIVLGSFIMHFGTTGNEVYVAIAANMAMVSVMIVQIIRSYYAAFSGLVESQIDLEKQHNKTIELSNQNRELAFCDALTGLSNRRAFFAHLEKTVEQANDKDAFAIAMIDLDGFKPVNDVHGHPAGDEVLMQASARLRAVLGPDVLLARLGGDEFGVIFEHQNDALELIKIGRALCGTLNDPFDVGGGTVQLSASLGFATYPTVARDPNALFERADFALYYAKKNMPGHPVIFAARHETLIRHDSQIEQALRKADLESELSIHFQPVFDLRNGIMHSVEVLARWDNEKMGRVSPEMFFPVAEKTGLVGTLSTILFQKAMKSMVDWPSEISLSFNLSARDIVLPDMAHWLIDQIKFFGIDPGRLTFEVTETALLRDFVSARASIRYLRRHGAKVALDDFGIGYSSLRYVHELEFDCLKIDRSFIAPIVNSERSQRIVKTVIDMCENLGTDCVIEGIETPEQRDEVLRLGGHLAQGYFFARPVAGLDWAALSKLAQGAMTKAPRS
ncbi:putative bifunctional diguanylate cyclase/phosphodiesterase [Thalassospira alkalitolerans]|uniref:putative bifunctional diguanylate cyclase/phosphodiesterase n=1 Tax=Thalassospira alkalitolerans TaxID=1293890 RepID=UPI003AA9A01B